MMMHSQGVTTWRPQGLSRAASSDALLASGGLRRRTAVLAAAHARGAFAHEQHQYHAQQQGRANLLQHQYQQPVASVQGSYRRRLPSALAPRAAASSSGSAQQSSDDSDEDYGYMKEYAALKQQLLDNTRKAGGVIGGYLLLTVGGGPALACMLGAAGSYVYFSWLCQDVDAVKPTDTVPIWEANKIENPLLRRAAKVTAAYRAALRPRLLVPVGLAAAVSLWNALSGRPLPLLYEGCMLGGFLSYKGALLTKLLQELLPKSYGAQGESRPRLEAIGDDLDQWGRPKKAARTPIDALPADAQEKAKQQLEQREAAEAEKESQLQEREAQAAQQQQQRRGGGGQA